MSTPTRILPPTPGPNRIHRPHEDNHYTPYEPVHFPSRIPFNNENRALAPSAQLLSEPSPFTASQATPTRVQPQFTKIDRLLHKMDVWTAKDNVYAFAELPEEDHELMMYLNIMKLCSTIADQEKELVQTRELVHDLKKYVSGNWNLTEIQKTLLTELLGHWLIKLLKSYDHIYGCVGCSIHLHAEWLHLGIYVTDPIARTVVDKFLSLRIGKMKGTFCKEIIASINPVKPVLLEQFACAMLTKYHTPIMPSTVPKDTMAALAFLRSITAKSMATKSNRSQGKVTHGNNTGSTDITSNTTSDISNKNYWRLTETKLVALYLQMGDDRTKGIQWGIWQDEIIAADNAKYKDPANVQPTSSTVIAQAAAAATTTTASSTRPMVMMIGTAADMENNSFEASSERSATFSIPHACTVPVNFPAHTMNGEVQMADLSDVASVMGTMPNPY